MTFVVTTTRKSVVTTAITIVGSTTMHDVVTTDGTRKIVVRITRTIVVTIKRTIVVTIARMIVVTTTADTRLTTVRFDNIDNINVMATTITRDMCAGANTGPTQPAYFICRHEIVEKGGLKGRRGKRKERIVRRQRGEDQEGEWRNECYAMNMMGRRPHSIGSTRN